MKRVLAMTIVAFAMSACALTSKGDAVWPRYFTPEPLTGEATARAPRGDGAMRLGHVDAASHLRERLVWRAESGEIGFSDDRRWTEKPDVYLRRALAHALFDEAGLRQVVEGEGLTLDVELVEFEELRGKTPRVRLRMNAVLHDSRVVAWQDTVVVERPLPPDGQSAASGAPTPAQTVKVVRALATALTEAVRTVATHSVREATRVAKAAPAEGEPCDRTSVAAKP